MREEPPAGIIVDEGLERSDIRSDPKTGAMSVGVPLRLEFRVAHASGRACAPLAGARLDVWHSDAHGRYSDTRGFGEASTRGQQFLRGGYQVTDGAGVARFLTPRIPPRAAAQPIRLR